MPVYLYWITQHGMTFAKCGYHKGTLIQLRKRYATYYGKNFGMIVFEVPESSRNAATFETIVHSALTVKENHFTNELFFRDGFQTFLNICTEICLDRCETHGCNILKLAGWPETQLVSPWPEQPDRLKGVCSSPPASVTTDVHHPVKQESTALALLLEPAVEKMDDGSAATDESVQWNLAVKSWKTDDGLLMYACTRCNKTFRNKAHCTRHLLKKIPCDKPKDLTCHFCLKVFSRKFNLERHVKEQH